MGTGGSVPKSGKQAAGGVGNKAAAAGAESTVAGNATVAVAAAAAAAPPTQLRVIQRALPPGATLSHGVGAVIGARTLEAFPPGIPSSLPPPPSPVAGAKAQNKYGWFVEDLERPGQFDAYNEESSNRLEEAFRARRTTCLVTLQKHMYTVDLTTMQQMPSTSNSGAAVGGAGARIRNVKRAAMEEYKDPATGQKVRREAAAATRLADPFAEETDDTLQSASQSASATAGAESVEANTYSTALDGATASLTYPKLAKTVVVHTKPIYTMHLSPATANVTDSGARQLALTGSMNRQLYEWAVETGRVVTTYDLQLKNPAAAVSVLTAHYAPLSGSLMIAGCDDRIARLYRRGEKIPIFQLTGHTHKVYGVSLAHDDSVAVTGAMDGFVKRWDTTTGSMLSSEHCHGSHIFVVKCSLSASWMALSAGDDAFLCVHDFRMGQSVVQRLAGHTRTVWDCDIHPQHGQQYLSAGMDNTIRLWDPRNTSEAISVMEHHEKPVHCARYTANGRAILSSSKDQYVYLASVATGEPVWRAKAHAVTVFRALFSPITNQIYTAAADGCVNGWNWQSGTEW